MSILSVMKRAAVIDNLLLNDIEKCYMYVANWRGVMIRKPKMDLNTINKKTDEASWTSSVFIYLPVVLSSIPLPPAVASTAITAAAAISTVTSPSAGPSTAGFALVLLARLFRGPAFEHGLT